MVLSNNIKGSILMSMAMAGYTINDALVKSTLDTLSTGQIIFVRGIISSVLIFAMAAHFSALRPLKTIGNPILLLRVGAEMCATMTYILALAVVPLAIAASIVQFIPLAVTLGAAIFFAESVGWRRWSAIIIGFVGVMIIIRPGAASFDAASILVFISVIFAAGRDLLTRRVPQHIPSLFVTLVTTVSITSLGALLIVPLGGWQPMTLGDLLRLTLASVFLLIGYQSLIAAMRIGEVSFIAPFRYTGLLWAILLGFFMFGSLPDKFMLSGAAVVIVSGLYTFYRENKLRTRELAQKSAPRVMH
ncbi:DMT family transporter [Rhizobium sp. L1K21]|uniref:DMT family transporter n=1 Tax=Rhizobium sp. L1K21 TaxID=2954933 RepID=UPI002092DDD7|nr:DMT family transporter [Rhizobium sp. L1K21]MCO6186343.1 DMT family transporter [Rhizobium sp. L1K21]